MKACLVLVQKNKGDQDTGSEMVPVFFPVIYRVPSVPTLAVPSGSPRDCSGEV